MRSKSNKFIFKLARALVATEVDNFGRHLNKKFTELEFFKQLHYIEEAKKIYRALLWMKKKEKQR